MYKSFMKVLNNQLKNREASSQRVSSPRAGEDAAKRQVRGLAKSINRNASKQWDFAVDVVVSTIVAIVLSVIPEIRYRESAVSRGCLTTATAKTKGKGRFPITNFGNDNTGRSALTCSSPLSLPSAVIAGLTCNLCLFQSCNLCHQEVANV
jgi:hypothetical protein